MPELPPEYACNNCRTAAAFRGACERMPLGCPTLTHPEITKDVSGYLEADAQELMQVANQSPFDEAGKKRTRVDELIFYAHERGYERIGIAFCVSMTKESQELVRQLEAANLTAYSVCCRAGAMDYDTIGLPKAHPERFASICNPIAQARLLNEAGVQLAVNMGLCIGHDILLQEHCDAPVTTLVVKDRALDHHPIEALRPRAGPLDV